MRTLAAAGDRRALHDDAGRFPHTYGVAPIANAREPATGAGDANAASCIFMVMHNTVYHSELVRLLR